MTQYERMAAADGEARQAPSSSGKKSDRKNSDDDDAKNSLVRRSTRGDESVHDVDLGEASGSAGGGGGAKAVQLRNHARELDGGPVAPTLSGASDGDGDGDGVGDGVDMSAARGGGYYRTYKRRWFGLVQLTLLNIIVSWDWLTFSPVASTAAEFFDVSESAINWLSTGFLFAFVAISPLTILALHRGPKVSIVAAAGFILVGNWIRYAGTRCGDDNGRGSSFPAVMFGQIVTGLAQPFVLSAPTRYSDLWFTSRGRVAATALTSLANPLGAALGQLIVPFWVGGVTDMPNMVLYVSVMSSICALPAFFIPSHPPTPPSPSGSTPKMSLQASIRVLLSSPEIWLIMAPFAVYVGFFNSLSSLLSQIFTPYGFSDDDAGIGGALLIVVGLVASAVASPLIDRTKRFVLTIKITVPVIALSYLVFVWMPATRSLPGPYVVLSILGAASFALLPIALECLIELSHPVSPEVTSTIAWVGGQLLGGCFILISDALKDTSPDADPPANMYRALVFQAVVALAVMPLPMTLGWFGRGDKLRLRRVLSDRSVDSGSTADEMPI